MSILRRLILILALCFMPCLVYAQNIGVMMQEADGNPASTYTYKLILPNGSITSITSSVATLNFLTPTGDGSGLSGVVTTETDPVASAINGVLCSNGAALSACSNLTNLAIVFVEQANCATITGGCCKDTDNGYVYCWDGDSVEEVARPGSVTSIADPNADRIYFWDDSETLPALLTPYGSISISTTNLLVISQTPVIDDADNFAANFTGGNLYGGTFIANAAGTAALPDPAVGMHFTIVLEAAAAVVINPDTAGTADTIVMNGLAANQDENITSSTVGAMCVFQYRAANSWMATCNGFAEATPP